MLYRADPVPFWTVNTMMVVPPRGRLIGAGQSDISYRDSRMTIDSRDDPVVSSHKSIGLQVVELIAMSESLSGSTFFVVG